MKIEKVLSIMGHYVDQPCNVTVHAVTDPNPNCPESMRVMVAIEPGFQIKDADGQPVDLAFGMTVEGGELLIGALEEAVEKAKVAMGRARQ